MSEETADSVQWTGTKVRFVPMDEASGYELSDWELEPGAPGPPIHVHHEHDEGFYVMAGSFGFVLDGVTTYAKPGAFVLVPKDHSHSYWNAGARPGRLLLIVSPPGMTEYFRATAAALEGIDTREGLVAAREQLQERYDMQIVGPPPGPDNAG